MLEIIEKGVQIRKQLERQEAFSEQACCSRWMLAKKAQR
jgi:hypothetical protein